jgi:outer membrane protein assembly factor BamB
MSRQNILASILVLCSFLLGSAAPPAAANGLDAVQGQRPGFPVVLDTGRVKFGSVTLADLNGDQRPEILVGSETGILYVLNADGGLRWKYNVTAALNAAAAGQPRLNPTSAEPTSIRSAPAVADVTGDGVPEIFVGAGDVLSAQAHGGVVGLTASGALLPGWPQLTCDVGNKTPPPSYFPQLTCAQLNGGNGYSDGVVSSPSIGDITGDGVPEIVYGAFDQLTYAREPNGTLLPGWPQHALDTIWGSPAIADLTGDGVSEVIIGVDAHRYRGPSWNAEFRETFDGGYLMAYSGAGAILWASRQDEVFESSPAVADVDGDGKPEIFTGSGTFYSIYHSPPNPALGRYVTAWNHDGTQRWRAPLPTQVTGDPALGNLLGDDGLEVVVGGRDGKAYAIDAKTGSLLWSTTARETFGGSFPLSSPVLGDYTGDGRDDVFLGLGWDVVVLRGTDGAQLTATDPTDPNKPSYYGAYTVNGVPALGDLDDDGKLELVSAAGNQFTQAVGNTQVNSWDLPSASGVASWPMLRRTPAHKARMVPKLLMASSSSLGALLTPGQTRSFDIAIASSEGGSVSWSVSRDGLQNVSVNLSRSSGDENDTLRVTIDPSSSGSFSGTLRLTASGFPTVEIPISGKVVSEIYKIYTPLQSK